MITSSLPYCIISIHAPREGGDLDFLGTVLDFIISIHAPREGGDLLYGKIRHLNQDFNPRPPRGGRPRPLSYAERDSYFNPRPPRGGRLGSCLW